MSKMTSYDLISNPELCIEASIELIENINLVSQFTEEGKACLSTAIKVLYDKSTKLSEDISTLSACLRSVYQLLNPQSEKTSDKDIVDNLRYHLNTYFSNVPEILNEVSVNENKDKL